jgi:hypothetical protein
LEDEEEEQQEEVKVEEPQEEVQAAAIAEKCDMTPRLQFWYGNSKDRTSIKWWCDAVDRIKDQKGWNDDQGKKSAALVAVDALREEAALLMSIIAKGHQAGAVKYLTIKRCTQRAKQFATLTQKSGEPVENFYDRTQIKWAIKGEQSRGGLKGQHSISAVQVEEQQQPRDKTHGRQRCRTWRQGIKTCSTRSSQASRRATRTQEQNRNQNHRRKVAEEEATVG